MGETLTSDTSASATPTVLTNVSYSYQWVRNDGTDDEDISNATNSTYILVDEDAGKTIKVKVSFTDDAGNQEALTSAATATVERSVQRSVTTVTPDSDPGNTLENARDLGDITNSTDTIRVEQEIDQDDDAQDYYKFTLTERKSVTITLTQQDADADLQYIGSLISPTFQNNLDGAADESISADILAGTFYILLTAQESGANAYRLEITVGEPTVELPPQDSTVIRSLESNTTPETPATRTTDLGDMTESGKTFYHDRVNGGGHGHRQIYLHPLQSQDDRPGAPPPGRGRRRVHRRRRRQSPSTAATTTAPPTRRSWRTCRMEATPCASRPRSGAATTTRCASTSSSPTRRRCPTHAEVDRSGLDTSPDAAPAHATDLGDLTSQTKEESTTGQVNGGSDGADYYRFTLRYARDVTLKLMDQDANANLYLESGANNVITRSTAGSSDDDTINSWYLAAGTYYVRIAAQETGNNSYTLKYRATRPVVVRNVPNPDPTAARAKDCGAGLSPSRPSRTSTTQPATTPRATPASAGRTVPCRTTPSTSPGSFLFWRTAPPQR